jgi:hypothetical protein
VSRYSFPGYTAFLQEAARRIGHPEAEGPARKVATLAALGNLCAQAGDADPEHVPTIMAKAAEFRDQLHAAYQAAELMLEDVSQARCPHPEQMVEKLPAQSAPPNHAKEKKHGVGPTPRRPRNPDS